MPERPRFPGRVPITPEFPVARLVAIRTACTGRPEARRHAAGGARAFALSKGEAVACRRRWARTRGRWGHLGCPRDHRHAPPASGTTQRIGLEDLPQQLRPAHRPRHLRRGRGPVGWARHGGRSHATGTRGGRGGRRRPRGVAASVRPPACLRRHPAAGAARCVGNSSRHHGSAPGASPCLRPGSGSVKIGWQSACTSSRRCSTSTVLAAIGSGGIAKAGSREQEEDDSASHAFLIARICPLGCASSAGFSRLRSMRACRGRKAASVSCGIACGARAGVTNPSPLIP